METTSSLSKVLQYGKSRMFQIFSIWMQRPFISLNYKHATGLEENVGICVRGVISDENKSQICLTVDNCLTEELHCLKLGDIPPFSIYVLMRYCIDDPPDHF